MMISAYYNFNGLPGIKREDGYWVLSPYAKKIIQFDKIGEKEMYDLQKYSGSKYPYGPLANNERAHITLVLTNNCNLSCRYCSVCLKSDIQTISYEIIDSAVEYIFERFKQKEFIISFFGGEPTLAFEEMRYACEKFGVNAKLSNRHVKFTLTTNGVFDNDVANFMIENRFSILFSMDGPAYIQNSQRPLINGGDSFRLAYSNLKKLLEHKISLTVSVTLTNYSAKFWKDIYNLFKDTGVKSIQIDPVFPFPWSIASRNNEMKFLRCTVDEYIEAVIGAYEMGRKDGIICSNPVFARLFKPVTYFCDLQAGEQAIVINYNGDLLKCAEVQDILHPLYNKVKVGYYDNVLKKIISNDAENKNIVGEQCKNSSVCSECFAFSVCCGGCNIRNQLISGAQFGEDTYFCEIFKKLLGRYIDIMACESKLKGGLHK